MSTAAALAERSTPEDVACAACFKVIERPKNHRRLLRVKLGADRETRRSPFRKSAAQSTRAPAALSQELDGTIGVDAVRSATVGDVFLVLWQPAQPAFQLGDGDRDRASDVSRGVFVGGAGIEHDDVAATKTGHQVLEGHRLGVGPVAKFLTDQALEVSQPTLGDEADSPRQLEHSRIRQRIVNEQTLASRLDQAGLLQGLQMLRGIRGRETDFAGQRLDGPFALGEQLENLEAGRTRQPFADARVELVETFFERSRIGHRQVFNILLEYVCQQVLESTALRAERLRRSAVLGSPMATKLLLPCPCCWRGQQSNQGGRRSRGGFQEAARGSGLSDRPLGGIVRGTTWQRAGTTRIQSRPWRPVHSRAQPRDLQTAAEESEGRGPRRRGHVQLRCAPTTVGAPAVPHGRVRQPVHARSCPDRQARVHN